MSAKNIVLSIGDWDTSSIKYMAPKINDKGGKSISIISKQTNRMLHISTPLMMTWGISDFVDDKGESDGKFSISLNFPNDEYRTPATDEFLEKLKQFENQILDDAVHNAESWWGEAMSREVCKHTFFPFLKYSKNKDTKKVDLTRPPSIRAKVPFYSGKWGVEIYDTASNLIFPCEMENVTPMDFVPKLSRVACGLQCTGIWIGGKGWGLTWKMFQCIVKPREVVSVMGRCQIQLSAGDKAAMEEQMPGSAEPQPTTVFTSVPSAAVPSAAAQKPVQTTEVPDSDEENDPEPEPDEPAPAPVAVTPSVHVAEAPKKKIVKKKAP